MLVKPNMESLSQPPEFSEFSKFSEFCSVSGSREVGAERFSTVTRAGEGAGLGMISPI